QSLFFVVPAGTSPTIIATPLPQRGLAAASPSATTIRENVALLPDNSPEVYQKSPRRPELFLPPQALNRNPAAIS
ncbi:MAG: hypothetical protein OEV91_09750, partial [Desulfobulbaceae bacterium]|nr:hypothetical protein [Desulfobulbaceae bacterium]